MRSFIFNSSYLFRALVLISLGVGAGCGDDATTRDVTDAGIDVADDTSTDTEVSACQATCDDEGARKCDGAAVLTCADVSDNGCLTWTVAETCSGADICELGACKPRCQDEPCTAVGARSCDDNEVVTCGDYDDDGCLEWGAATDCEDLVCANGFCAVTGSDECTVAGARSCEGNGVVTCGDFNDDGFLEWSAPADCGDDVCSNGSCALSCTDTCPSVGATRCSPAGVETCGAGTGCLAWGTAVACDAGETCSNGACATTCTDECDTVDVIACDGAAATRTCGNYDADSCLEWGTSVPCETAQACVTGVCEDLVAPVSVIISEFMINTDGNPDTNSFVELAAAPGTSLDGVTLVGVNGNGGADYATIPLSGTVPADGFFVIAHSGAQPFILDMADFSNNLVDFQNGPDSIQVRFGAIVLDAVGYGTFTAPAVFAGEGTPVAVADVDRSLSRDDDLTDTHNNAADFADRGVPTPGRTNTPIIEPPGPDALVAAFVSNARGQYDIQLDATRSAGGEGSLEFRWDIGADGSWEYDWSVARTTIHTFAAVGTYPVKLEVRDTADTVATITRDVTVHTLQTVSGTLPAGDVYWSGTIVLTGLVDTRLTTNVHIAPGTSVLATWTDSDGDNIGDYGLIFEAPLIAAGTEEEPIYFGSFEKTDAKKRWQGIDLNRAGNDLSWVTVENANNCINIYTTTTLTDVETRNCTVGVRTDSGSAASTATRLYTHHNTDGVRRDSGIITVTDSKVASNQYGFWIETDRDAIVTRTNIEGNAPYGVYLNTDRWGTPPKATFNLNNIPDAIRTSTLPEGRHDFRFNYWGEARGYPNVAVESPRYVNFEGFMGVPFDKTWSRGPYVGGERLTADTSWSGTVYLNGSIEVSELATLTIVPGTRVLVAPTDVDGTPYGDFGIDVLGALVARGTGAAPIILDAVETDALPGAWRGIALEDGDSDLTYVELSRASTGIAPSGGTHTWSHTTIAESARDNVFMSGVVAATLDRLSIVDAVRNGLNFDNARGTVAVTNTTIAGNMGRGVRIRSGSPTLTHCHIAENGTGVWLDEATTASITSTVITANRHEGIMLRGDIGASVNGNNIYGNSTESGLVVFDPNAAAWYDDTPPITTNKDTLLAPTATDRLVFAKMTVYNFLGFRLYIRYVNSASDIAVFTDLGSSGTTIVDVDDLDIRGFDFIVARNGGTSAGSAGCRQAVYRTAGAAIELGAFFGTGAHNVRDNYWGVFPDVASRVATAEATVDYDGFLATPVSGAGLED